MSATGRPKKDGTRTARKARDAYYTRDDLASFLVGLLPVEGGQWALEPSVGGGAFARALKVRGLRVMGVDVHEAAGFTECDASVIARFEDIDPLKFMRAAKDERFAWTVGFRLDWTIGNPPFTLAEKHVRHALKYSDNVAFLLRSAFLETKRRIPFWEEHPAHRIFALSERPSFTGGGTDMCAYSFFWWRKGSAEMKTEVVSGWKGYEWGLPGDTRDENARPKDPPLYSVSGHDNEHKENVEQGATSTMKELHVTEIASSVKGGGTYSLGPKTLIIGPCGSRKSGIVNAVELALTGRVSDIAGRAEVAVPADLLALAPGREGTLWAEATLSDGESVRWETEARDAGSAKRPTHHVGPVDPATVLPLRPLREAILGRPDKARRYFLQTISGLVTPDDVLSRLPGSLHETFHAAAGDVLLHDPQSALFTAREYALSQVKTAKKALRDADAVLANAHILPTRATAQQREEAQQAVVRARTALEDASRADGATTAVSDLQARVADVSAKKEGVLSARLATQNAIADGKLTVSQADAAIMQSDNAIAALQLQVDAGKPDPTLAEKGTRLQALGLLVEFAQHRGHTACLTCGHDVDPGLWAQRLDEIATLAERITGAMAQSAEAAQAQALIGQWAEYRDKAVALKNQTGQTIEAAERRLRDLDAEETQLDAENERLAAQIVSVFGLDGSTSPALSLESARDALLTAQETLQEYERAAGAWAAVDSAREDKAAAATTLADAERLAEACQQAMDELLRGALDAFCVKVQSFLPATDVYALRLEEGKREVFQHGLLRDDGVLHTALSGAEWARVTAAEAAALCEGRNDLAVIIPEERAYDPDTLRAVMKALRYAPAQVILTSPIKHAGRCPAGWTVLDVGGET